VAYGLHRPFGHHRFPGRSESVTDVYHRVVCRHQVEIEVWPPRAEVHFNDDWTANPIDTQTRFEATVYNSNQGHLWEVRALDGSPGLGTIDASGLYRAPPKGALPNGFTEIVVATAREDGLRKAYAWVTLVGFGPEPVTAPTVDMWPKRVNLYYRQGANNNYIDDSNKMRQFGAVLRNSAGSIEWFVKVEPSVTFVSSGTGPWFLYQAPNTGSTNTVTIRAELQGQPSVFDEAKVLLLNYFWPGA
jgi:hypothetical protein